MRGLECSDYVIAGSFKNKVQEAAAKVMPETQTASMHAQQIKPH